MPSAHVPLSSAQDLTRVDSSPDQYELIAEIAHGGMATVFLGRLVRSHGFNRPVAIKRMHRHLAAESEFRAMFVDEALLVAKIRHPNVVPTLDIVARGTELLAVMELVDGAPLTDVAKAHGRAFPPRIAAAIVHDVLCGLHAAHTLKGNEGEHLGVIHRDVSPSNILVGTDGSSRILDFGIAKALGRTKATLTGTVKGKTRYMAPEQLLASPVLGPGADVFAAGVVLWEMLTGRRLFTGRRGFEGGIEEARLEPPSAIRAEAASLDEVVMRALESDPDARFESALDMARALEEAISPSGRLDVADFVGGLTLASRDRVQRLVRDYETGEHSECSLVTERTRPRMRSTYPTNFSDDAPAEPQTGTHELAARWLPARPSLPRFSRKHLPAVAFGALLGCALICARALSPHASPRQPELPAPKLVMTEPMPAPSAVVGSEHASTAPSIPEKRTRGAASKAARPRAGRLPSALGARRDEDGRVAAMLRDALLEEPRPGHNPRYAKFD